MISEKKRRPFWKCGQQFPEDGDLKVAAGEYARAVYRLDLTEDKIRQQRAQTDEAAKLLEDIRKEAAKACGKCYLPHRMDTVCQTAAALIQYREQLTKLQLHYGKYANGLEYIKIRQEYLEELDSDLDDIRYELGQCAEGWKKFRRILKLYADNWQ